MKRYQLHLLFWLVFFCISLYNDLYFSDSFSAHPSWELLGKAIFVQLLIYSVKIVVVYYLLYAAIPTLLKTPRKIIVQIQIIGVILIGTLLIRILIQNIIWVYVNSEIRNPLTYAQLLARYFYSLLDLLQLTGFAAAIKLFRSRLGAIEREKNLMQAKAKAEILLLKAQTNPHFLFNTLNSIFSLTRSQSKQAPQAIIKLSKILRYMLYETKNNMTTITSELAIIKDYIALQKLRFQEHIQVKITNSIDSESTLIASLLLLPLVENAFKHSNEIEVAIEIILTVEKGQLDFMVKNPISELTNFDNDLSHEGIGLKNIQQQLALQYHDFTFVHYKENNIFTVHLTINTNSYAATELFNH